jgi:hypothetical protein
MDTDLRAQGGNGARVFVKSTMSSVIAEHVSEGLTFVYAHVLPEVIMTTEFLPTSLDRTLVRCNSNTKSKSLTANQKQK